VIGALDLGSNTLKITVAEKTDGELRIVEERSVITRIGEGLDENGYVTEEAIARTMAGLSELVAAAQKRGADRIACVATAGLRGASNAGAFLSRVKAELGIDVEIIDGLREAELAFRAPSKAYGPGPIAVLDVGGRSTEIVTGEEGTISSRVSLEIGSVRLTERYVKSDPPKPVELERARAHLDDALKTAPAVSGDAKLIGVSGTVLSLMGWSLDLFDMGETVAKGEGKPLSYGRVLAAFDDLSRKTTPERIRGTVIPPGRADVIVQGALIVLAVMARYQKDAMIVSNRGVRYGLLEELLV
jgi:exopolyphosphatase/guanosine-5'-triphosphate,3'-diphosphate pyrophosphatase